MSFYQPGEELACFELNILLILKPASRFSEAAGFLYLGTDSESIANLCQETILGQAEAEMARTVGVYKGPNNLQEVFGNNIPNPKPYASFETLFQGLEAGEIDGVVIPQEMLPAKMPVTQIVNGFAYVRPSMEVRLKRMKKRFAARREARENDAPMRCSSFAP